MTKLSKRHTFRATVTRLPVADLTETLEFYVGKLGFEPLYRGDGEAGVGLGEIIVRFCDGEQIKNENLSIYFEITDTDDLFKKYDAEGVQVRFPPQDQPWGSRDFGIQDPNGYRLVFGDFRDRSRLRRSSPRVAAAIESMLAGDIDQLRRLLDADPDLVRARAPVKYGDKREATLLHFLMDYPDGDHPSNIIEIATLLIDSGADAESLDGDTAGSTPLQLLMGLDSPIAHGSELTKLLLRAGASSTKANEEHGMDAFTVALLVGHTDCAAEMFEHGYPPNFSWAGAGLGNMRLVRAFFGEDDGSSDLPHDQRADQLGDDAQNAMNCAFLVAAINGQTEVVDYLLDKGMDIDLQPPGSDFAGIGATALHRAARHGHSKTVERLVARGADTLARDDVFQLTPAGWAAWYGHDEIKRSLLAKEKDADK